MLSDNRIKLLFSFFLHYLKKYDCIEDIRDSDMDNTIRIFSNFTDDEIVVLFVMLDKVRHIGYMGYGFKYYLFTIGNASEIMLRSNNIRKYHNRLQKMFPTFFNY